MQLANVCAEYKSMFEGHKVKKGGGHSTFLLLTNPMKTLKAIMDWSVQPKPEVASLSRSYSMMNMGTVDYFKLTPRISYWS